MNSKLKTTLFWFVIIQPFLDIFYLYQPPITTFFKFSPATILRILIVAIISVLFLWTSKNKKLKLFLGVYTIVLILYFIGHHLNAMHFHSLVAGNFGYSLFGELFYVVRMVLPLIILVVSYNIKFTDNQLESIVSWLVALVSGSIVVTNLFKISLSSYVNQRITGNIFSWFFNKQHGSYFDLASKGFFNFANSTAALEVLLLPLMLYFLIKHTNAKTIILSLVQILAMFMLGTKVSTLGGIGVLVLMTFMYLFFTLIKRDLTFNKSILGILFLFIVLSGVLYPVSPAINRTNFDAQIQQERDGDKAKVKEREKKLEKKSKEKENSDKKGQSYKETPLIKYIRKHYAEYSINAQFIEVSYPYYADPTFWQSVMKWPIQDRISFRKIEIAMLNRVKEVNNNPQDNLFGISYTRMNNIFNVERDFASQYYSMGIIGVLLLVAPYVFGVIYLVYELLRHFKTKFTLRNTAFMLGIVGILGVSMYSGNVMDFLTATFILAFFEGQLLVKVKRQPLFKEHKISLIMPTYNDAATITDTLESIRTQAYEAWELVIVDDGSTDNTKKTVTEYIKEHALQARMKYVYKENGDQLNAIKYGAQFITGDYVNVIHSDDTFFDANVLSKMNNKLALGDSDGILANLNKVNNDQISMGVQWTPSYIGNAQQIKTQTLWLGRNLFIDVAFWKKDIFLNEVMANYLENNTPNWLDLQRNSVRALNFENADFNVINYRIYEENYINSEVGNLNVLNGELRTLVGLLGHYQVPGYEKQYKVFRLFNKLKLLSIYWPLAFRKASQKATTGRILQFAIQKRVTDFEEMPYLEALVKFYQFKDQRQLKIAIPADVPIYTGADMRSFNQKLVDGKLEPFYMTLLSEMRQGFTEISVAPDEMDKWQTIVQFLNIQPYVRLEMRG